MLMMCNRVPPIRNTDAALRRRFVIIPFQSMWVDDPPNTSEEQYACGRFKKDERELDYMAPALLWMMCGNGNLMQKGDCLKNQLAW